MLDINKIRNDFPILSRKINGKPLIYFDNAATTQKPISVINSLTDFYTTYNSNVHRGVHTLSMQSTDLFEEARNRVAKFINSQRSESIIWTRNTTEGINLVANAWGKKNITPGDEIVVTAMEHHSNLVPWQILAETNKAKLVIIPINDDGTLNLNNIDTIINSKTKIVSVVHMSNSLGTINPIHELCEKAHKVGAKFLLDGAQSAPHMPINVKDYDCDFLVFSGHKMLGPTGIGVLYVKPDILENMEPFLTGGEMVLEVSYEKASWNELPMKFEAGTPNIADAIALGEAIIYLEKIGMEQIREHEIELTNYALNKFEKLNNLTLFGPLDSSIRGGIFSFHSEYIHPHDLGTFLDNEGIAIRTGHHCTMPLIRSLNIPATSRASFYIYNTKDEIDYFIQSLQNAIKYFTHDK
ncbi:MAG: cysteine desulfurase [Chloroflexi bacterium]|nr:cysteine desulfurase [Chloroflexota bacterium]|tara:strand:- start:23245 stop:24477 length:1233 start_codon:yes stop_codon:yes gene_type:complete